jgi:hypothetical protein
MIARWRVLPMSLFMLCIGSGLHAQTGKVVVLSPRVGTEIDADERDRYALFQHVRNFQRAVFRHTGDSAFVLILRIGDGQDGHRDSSQQLSFRSVIMLAEKIDHYEELQRDQHRMGTAAITLYYEDGTPVQMHMIAKPVDTGAGGRDSVAVPHTRMVEYTGTPAQTITSLPLAPNKRGLRRPRFRAFDFVVGCEAATMDIGTLEPLIGSPGELLGQVSLRLGIHVMEEPILRLLGGWSFIVSGGEHNDVTVYSVFLLLNLTTFGDHGPVVGLGAGRIEFNFSRSDLVIRGGYSYPQFVFGWSFAQTSIPAIDFLFSLPVGSVTTDYQEKTYTISPAGPAFTVMLSF